MNVTVIGAGKVGGALAARWSEAGNVVTIGARDPDRARETTSGIDARIAPLGEAAAEADAVLLAVPGVVAEEVMAVVGPTLGAATLIDATNNLAASPDPINARAAVERAAPEAGYARAFNSIGWEVIADPIVAGLTTDLYWASTDGTAAEVAGALITDSGFRSVRLGGLDKLDLVDRLLDLWASIAYGENGTRRTGLIAPADPT
ncbi:MAG: NADPH-dependent F420 reductase [Microthrixaceae bacterium]